MIGAPAITTAIGIPVLVARNVSAYSWRISFLILELIEKTKTRRTRSPGRNRAFHPDQSLLGEKWEGIWVLVHLLVCHLQADTAPVQ